MTASRHFEGLVFDELWTRAMQEVLERGHALPDRTGAGRTSLPGVTIFYSGGRLGRFPAVTTKQLFTGQMWGELAGFLRGHSWLEDFEALGCTIWNANARAHQWASGRYGEGGESVGRIYGVQWRSWRSWLVDYVMRPGDKLDVAEGEVVEVDQIKALVKSLCEDPWSRRHIVTALNPGESAAMCLPPCHVMFQCHVEPQTKWPGAGHADAGDAPQPTYLTMQVYMRSVDMFLGLPFDVASYATLQALLCREAGLACGDLVFNLGDAHVYHNHREAVETVVARVPYPEPRLLLNMPPSEGLFDFRPDHASLPGYHHHSAVKAAMNV